MIRYRSMNPGPPTLRKASSPTPFVAAGLSVDWPLEPEEVEFPDACPGFFRREYLVALEAA